MGNAQPAQTNLPLSALSVPLDAAPAAPAVVSTSTNKTGIFDCKSDSTTKIIECNFKLPGQMEPFGNREKPMRNFVIKALLLFTLVLLVISVSNDLKKLKCTKKDNNDLSSYNYRGHNRYYTDDEKPDNIIVLI